MHMCALPSSYFIALQVQSPGTLSNSLCNLLDTSPCKSAKTVVRQVAETVPEPSSFTFPNASQNAATHFSCVVCHPL